MNVGINVCEPYEPGVTEVSSRSISIVLPEPVVVIPVSPEIVSDSESKCINNAPPLSRWKYKS